GGQERRAVREREPFLGLEPEGLEARGSERLVAWKELSVEPGLTLADQRKGEVRKRREVAAGADRSATRHTRNDPRVQAVHDQLDRLDAGAGEALRERVGAKQHRGAHDLRWVRLADAAGVASKQAELKLFGEV